MLQFVTITFILEVFILESVGAFIFLAFLFYIAIIFGALFLQYIVAKKFEEIAIMKGYGNEIHSFAMCFWLGIIGYLYVIALPDLKHRARMSSIISHLQSKQFNGESK